MLSSVAQLAKIGVKPKSRCKIAQFSAYVSPISPSCETFFTVYFTLSANISSTALC